MVEAAQQELDSLVFDLVTQIAALFSSIPRLSGFSVQERATLSAEREAAPLDAELSVADVSVQPCPDVLALRRVGLEIADALLELLDQHPAARRLLRGQTFARTFH